MPPAPRAKRDCQCPRVRHEHGTRRAYERDRCRCLPCRAAHANATRAYRNGQSWNEATIDVTTTRAQLRALMAAGVTTKRVAAHSGLSADMVSYLRSGPSKRVTHELAATVVATYDALICTGRSDPDARRGRTIAHTHRYVPFADDEPMGGHQHGTHAAYVTHLMRKQKPCQPCTAGQARYLREQAAQRRKRAA